MADDNYLKDGRGVAARIGATSSVRDLESQVTSREELTSAVCNETATAKLFCEEHGDVLRWNPQWGWLIWNGERWERDGSGYLTQMAGKMGQVFRESAAQCRDERTAMQLFRWGKHCESAKGIQAVLKLAENRCFAPVEDFDADPMRLNFLNCAVDLRAGNRLPLEPAALCTKVIDARCRRKALHSRWDAFLESVQPDPDVRAYLQRAVGYSLSGSTREQCFFVLWGAGCNGKSTFLDVLLRSIGPHYAAQADPRSFMIARNETARTDLARLVGVRFLVSSEATEGRHLDEALIKAVTGGDALTVRHLYREEFEFHPTFKLWLATNHRPAISDTTIGMWRRVRLVPWEVQVPEAERDLDIKDRLLAEREGILQWALEGAAAYQAEGLVAPPSIAAATRSYREQEDVVGLFLATALVAAPGESVPLSTLYKVFCLSNDPRTSQNLFGRRVTEKVEGGHLPGTKLVLIRGTRCLRGMRLRTM